MLVTLVNKYYPPHLGGIEYHLRDLAQALAALPEFQPQVLVANEGRSLLAEIPQGVPVFRLPRLLAYSSTPVALGMPRALRRAARGGGVVAGVLPARHLPVAPTDLVHLHFPYPWGEIAWLLAGSPGPAVMTYHSDIVRQEKLLALYRPVLRTVLDTVDLVIASSPNMVEHSEFLQRVQEKCRVVPFGIEVERFASTAALARVMELRAAHTRPIVLFVGRLIYYKGVDVLIRAMAQVEADLVLIGRGPLEADLRRLAAQLQVADRVTFLSNLDAEELRAWYQAAAVFCLPSVARSEAFGLVQLEAQAAGTPVVSTRLTTGVPFVNLDGVTGLTVPPGDADALARALRRLLQDDHLRGLLGQQAQDRVRREFTQQRMVQRTIEVYEEAVQLHSQRASTS